jgi:hypothetical protein
VPRWLVLTLVVVIGGGILLDLLVRWQMTH